MSDRPDMEHAKPVLLGQRYREIRDGYLGRPSPVWIVEKTFDGRSDAIRYAHLIREDEPSQRKTLAVDVLADARRFRRLAEPD